MSTKKYAMPILSPRVSVSLTNLILKESEGYVKEIRDTTMANANATINRPLPQHGYHNRKQVKQLKGGRRR